MITTRVYANSQAEQSITNYIIQLEVLFLFVVFGLTNYERELTGREL